MLFAKAGVCVRGSSAVACRTRAALAWCVVLAAVAGPPVRPAAAVVLDTPAPPSEAPGGVEMLTDGGGRILPLPPAQPQGPVILDAPYEAGACAPDSCPAP